MKAIYSESLGQTWFAKSSKSIFIVGEDMMLKVINNITKEGSSEVQVRESKFENYAIDSHNGTIYFGGEGGTVYSLGAGSITNSEEQEQAILKMNGDIKGIAISKDGERLVAVGQDSYPILYDFKQQKSSKTSKPHKVDIVAVRWSPDSSSFATLDTMNEVFIFDHSGNFTRSTKLQVHPKESYSFIPDFLEDNSLLLPSLNGGLLKFPREADPQQIPGFELKEGCSLIRVFEDSLICIIGLDKISISAFEFKSKKLLATHVNSSPIIMAEFGWIDNALTLFFNTVEGELGYWEELMIPKSRIEVLANEKTIDSQNNDQNHKISSQQMTEIREAIIMEEEQVKPQLDQKSRLAAKKLQLIDESDELVHDMILGQANEIRAIRQADDKVEDWVIEDQDRRGEPSLKQEFQSSFMPSSTQSFDNQNYYCWNTFGRMLSMILGDEKVVDVQYSDSSYGRKIIPNGADYHMGTIGEGGALLASRGYMIGEDEYEDDELLEEDKMAKLSYFPALGISSWTEKLPVGENIVLITMSDLFIAVATNRGFIRLYSPQGVEFMIYSYQGYITTITAYENLLAIIYQPTAQNFGPSQKVKILDIITLRKMAEESLPLGGSASSILWAGFSKKGVFCFQDSNRVIHSLVNGGFWCPIFTSNSNIWVTWITDEDIYGIQLPYGESEPSPLASQDPKRFPQKIPMNNMTYYPLTHALIQREQFKFSSDNWGHMSDQYAGSSLTGFRRKTMPNQIALNKLSIDNDIVKINLCRKAAQEERNSDAIWLACLLENDKSIVSCKKMLQKMGKDRLVANITELWPFVGAKHFLSKEGLSLNNYNNPFPVSNTDRKRVRQELEFKAQTDRLNFKEKHGASLELNTESFKSHLSNDRIEPKNNFDYLKRSQPHTTDPVSYDSNY